MNHKIFCLLKTVGLVLCLSSLGCSGSDTAENSEPGRFREENLNPVSPRVAYPNDWSEVLIMANFAKTTIDAEAHFNTSRNTCGKDAYGAIELFVWNNLVTQSEKGLKLLTLTEPFCMDPPADNYKFMDGSVEVTVGPNTKKTLLEYVNGQICTKISDRELARNFLHTINTLVLVADKEDCPNGWGRD